MIDIATAAVGIVSVPKRWALKTPRRELSEDVSFDIGTVLIVEQPSSENRPQGRVKYTVHGTRPHQPGLMPGHARVVTL